MAYGTALYKSSGAYAVGTTSLSVSYPAGITAGNLVVMCTVWKTGSGSPSMNTPSGWSLQDTGLSQFNAGQGTQGGSDSGPVHSSIFYRIATGSLTGSVTLGWSSAISSCQSIILVYSKPFDTEWGSMYGLAGYDVSYGTSWSTVNYNNLTLKPNETIITCVGINTDLYTYSSRSFSQTGLSINTSNRLHQVTSNGYDQAITVNEHKVTAGTSSTSSWNYTMTSSSSSSIGNPTGVVMGMVIGITPLKKLKMYNGSSWIRKPIKMYNGSGWYYCAANIDGLKPIKRYTGYSQEQLSTLYMYPDSSILYPSGAAQTIYTTMFNGHETDAVTYDGWITLAETKFHKNAFSFGMTVTQNISSARTGYVYLSIEGVTYRTITITQAEGSRNMYAEYDSSYVYYSQWDTGTNKSCYPYNGYGYFYFNVYATAGQSWYTQWEPNNGVWSCPSNGYGDYYNFYIYMNYVSYSSEYSDLVFYWSDDSSEAFRISVEGQPYTC